MSLSREYAMSVRITRLSECYAPHSFLQYPNMFIGITGSRFAGKNTVAKWLISKHKFTLVSLRSSSSHIVEVGGKVFETPKELLEYVTRNWEENFVTCDVEKKGALELYRMRPFFLFLAMDGPVSIRYERYDHLCQKENRPVQTLKEFMRDDDERLFGAFAKLDINGQGVLNHSQSERLPNLFVHDLMTQADITIINSYQDLSELYSHLEKLDIINPGRLRPSWEDYFMYLSDLAALRSNCMKRRVGCILVKDHRVIATGYNGTPRGLKNCNEGGCDRCNSAAPSGTDMDKCLCLHAEENALLEAGRERIGEGCTLYCNTCPCLKCTIKLIQVGVKEVVYKNSYKMDKMTRELLEKAGVKLKNHVPLKKL